MMMVTVVMCRVRMLVRVLVVMMMTLWQGRGVEAVLGVFLRYTRVVHARPESCVLLRVSVCGAVLNIRVSTPSPRGLT